MSDGAIDLSSIFPRMYVRVVDRAHRDTPANFPGLNELVAQANSHPEQYAARYNEYQSLVDVFRAFVVAVQLKKNQATICANIPPLLDSEKTRLPLPKYHPTELAVTIAWYEYTDGRFRRAIGTRGGLFQGGVHVGVTRFLELATNLATDSSVIRELKAEASVPHKDAAWVSSTGRQFIAFTFEQETTANAPGQTKFAQLNDNLYPNAPETKKTSVSQSVRDKSIRLLWEGLGFVVFVFFLLAVARAKLVTPQGATKRVVRPLVPDAYGKYPNGAWAMPDLSGGSPTIRKEAAR